MKELIKGIFRKHHDYYKSLGVETIKQQMAQYRQVEEAYQGRFIFELLQNAIDRADRKVYIKLLDSDTLIVANDGESFTFNQDFNYKEGGSDRGDFQALCSIATSTKLQSKNIGNKGVGFKSVYSVCRYADVHCKSLIGESYEIVNFRLYDVFHDVNDLPSPDLAPILAKVQKENAKWGIPGYYFPRLLDNTPRQVSEMINHQGFVTVVAIPISKDFIKLTVDKINEFRSFHLHFIKTLKHFNDKIIHVNFNDEFERLIGPTPSIVCRNVSTEAFRLAAEANLTINEESKIAINLRPQKDSKGRLYNFLPTECSSLFPNIDIHADFQTSVDRKRIVLDQSTTIGKYNSQLLTEAYELIRSVFIGETAVASGVFSSKHLMVRAIYDSDNIQIFRKVFFNTYEIDCSRILRKHIIPSFYPDFNCFYTSIFALLSNCREYGESYASYENKAENLGKELSACKFLPDTECHSQRIFFRNNTTATIRLPKQINAEITSYSIPEHYRLSTSFKKGSAIKPFEDTNQVYSLYWQCSPDGHSISSESISEEEQIEILRSVAQLIGIERNHNDSPSPTWRFATINDSQEVSDKTRAAFALSTLFYRTISGKYKPGQTLREKDIDPNFIARLGLTKPQLNLLYNKTGVSRSSKYLYADKRLKEQIADGLDHIPALLTEYPSVRRAEAWDNLRIFFENKAIKPALVNENYGFFYRILRNDNNKQIFNDLRIANYEQFPPSYIDHLRQVRFINSAELRKFYTKFAKPLYDKDFVLILRAGRIEVGRHTSEFYVINNPTLLSENNPPLNLPILLTVKSPDDHAKVLETKLSISLNQSEKDESYNPDFLGYLTPEKLFGKISEGDLSESIADKVNKLTDLQLCFYSTLTCICQIGDQLSVDITTVPYLIEDKTINIKIDINYEQLNRHRIAQAYSEALFESEKYADAIELILCGAYTCPRNMNYTALPDDDTPTPATQPSPELPNIDINDYLIIEIAPEEEDTDHHTESLPMISTGDGRHHPGNVSPQSAQLGLSGEEAVCQQIARTFASEYPTMDKQIAAIDTINDFLLHANLSPIKFNPSNIQSSLWYTNGGTKPFDIITLSHGKVRLIEVKTTRGYNTLHLSKREMRLAALFPDNYYIYRVDTSNKRLEIIRNLIKPEHTFHTAGNYRISPIGLEIEKI